MATYYICAVGPRFPENYELGVRTGTWGVTSRHRRRIARVRPGDRIVFVVAGEFRSIHPVTSDPYEDRTPIWPPRDSDPYAYRVRIGPAEVSGSVPVLDLAEGIQFMRGKRWTGTLQGANGVFNDKLTPDDVQLIRDAMRIAPNPVADEADLAPIASVLHVQGTRWLPTLLAELAGLAHLEPASGYLDPFAGNEDWRSGLVSGIFADRKATLTLALLPVDREPSPTVLSALYGLSALKQAIPLSVPVRGLIFVPEREPELNSLLHGLPNLASMPFELRISLRN